MAAAIMRKHDKLQEKSKRLSEEGKNLAIFISPL